MLNIFRQNPDSDYNVKKLEKFNCIVAVQDGKLCRCKVDKDGYPEFWAGSLSLEEIRGPVEQRFLDAVNEALGTSFRLEEFNRSKKVS